MPLPAPTSYNEWVQLAEIRIVNVLRTRIAANIRQLEVKVSESGPPDKRPQPHVLQTALKSLMGKEVVRIVHAKGESKTPDTTFYTLAAYYPDQARVRLTDLLVPYRLFRMLANTEDYCAKPLEAIVEASFATDPRYAYQGKLPKGRPLDGVYLFNGKFQIGVEVKNVREWVYPMSGEVWVMIRKCLDLDALPLLVPRKMAYLTHAVFAQLGLMGFEFHRQVFAPSVAQYLTDIQHTDRLGYKDVITLPAAPYGPLAVFLQTALPANLERYRAKWEARRPLLEEFAIKRKLGDSKVKDMERQEHRAEFMHALFGDTAEDLY